MSGFERKTREALKYYVYVLVDPRSGDIFYVGKASMNNRPFDHLKADPDETKKARIIAAVRAAKMQPQVHILRHGMETPEIAEEVEAAVIDAFGLEKLANLCRGKRIEFGRATADELRHRYGSKPVRVSSLREPIMKIWINQTYSPTMTPQDLYDATRQFWYKVGQSVRTPREDGTLPYPTVLALVDNVVVMAYQVHSWLPAGTTMSTREWSGKQNLWEFIGKALPNHYLVNRRLEEDDGTRVRANRQGYGYIN